MIPYILDPRVDKDGVLWIDGQSYSSDKVIEAMAKHMTESRFNKISEVVAKKQLHLTPVLEDIYDRGNASAVMRTAEGLGLQNIHLIQPSLKFKESARVTQGADKWLDTRVWSNTFDCVQFFKSNNVQLVVTCLDQAKPIDEVDFSKPTALVLGNEKHGVSEEMKAAADHRVIIPMNGFTQSFNISVAGALLFYHALRNKTDHQPIREDHRKALMALYCLKSVDSAEKILKEKF